jgi:pyruvate formate lyase activating enzyme
MDTPEEPAGPFVREALLSRDVGGGRVQCCVCERRCRLRQGQRGFCGTRQHLDGRLYTLEYASISSISANPIEKKPLFHFYPGSRALTVGSWSCNFACPWCQNYEISKCRDFARGERVTPQAFMALMRSHACEGTSISFNEPTLLLEYALEVFHLARGEGYYNTFVTNGYMTGEALALLAEAGLDAMNIDIKGDRRAVGRYCGADVEKVWRNARGARERGIHVEITTLVIPGVNDGEGCLRGIAARIREELGADSPWHVTRYVPAYKFRDRMFVPPTSVGALEAAREIGMAEGLHYVYLGNVAGHPYEDTYCPRCGEVLLRRHGVELSWQGLAEEKRCPRCGHDIPIVGRLARP